VLDSIGDSYLDAVGMDAVLRLVGEVWRVEQEAVLILGMHGPTTVEPIFEAAGWGDGEVAFVADIEREVNLDSTQRESRVRTPRVAVQERVPWADQEARLGFTMKAAEAQEVGAGVQGDAARPVELTQKADAAHAQVAAIWKAGVHVEE